MSYSNYDHTFGRRNRIIGPSQLVAAANIFTPTSDQKYTLGLELDMNDATGRWFRYCQAAGTALSKALVNSSAALDAQAITSTVQTAYGVAAGETRFDVLLTTGNAWTDDALRDGWLLISDGGAAMSDMYMVKSNKWVTSGDDTVMRVEICDEGGLRNAIAVTDDVILFQSKYANTVVSATNPVSGMVGVSLADVAASYFYWAQFRGYCPVLVDGTDTVVVGDTVTLSDSVAGTIHLNDAAADDVIVGTCVHAGAVSEPCIIDLLIP
jgi:hypothetical protein